MDECCYSIRTNEKLLIKNDAYYLFAESTDMYRMKCKSFIYNLLNSTLKLKIHDSSRYQQLLNIIPIINRD